MDPSDKNRLWSLLSEERSIRFEVQNKALQLNNERHEQSKTVKSDEVKVKQSEIFTEIDTSPITNPENIRQTRGRLSRLLLSNKKLRDGLDDQNVGGQIDSFIPFLRDNVTLREDKVGKIKGSVRFQETKPMTKQSSSTEFVRPTPETKPIRMTRSLSPTPSKLNMYRLKMRSFDDDTDSLYNQRLSRSVKRPDIALKRGQDFSLSTILPIRTVSLDSPLPRPAKSSTVQTKPKDRHIESSGDIEINSVKDNNIRRPIKAGIDDRAVLAMEMDAFIRSQQNLSSLMSRIEEVKVEAALYMLFGTYTEILSPIGCSRVVLFKAHNNTESPPELVHTFPDGRSIPLDSNISGCILQAVNFKSSGNLNSPIDAIFSSTSTISPHSVYWNEFCIAASVGEDDVCDSWRCILSVPIHVDGKVTAIVLVTVDRSNSIIFDGVGSAHFSNPTKNKAVKWQDTMALQLLQQLKYFLEKKISAVQSNAVLSGMNKDLVALANKDFIHSQMLPVLQSLNLSSGGVVEVVSNMLHAVDKLGVVVSGANSEVVVHGNRQLQQQHPCWMLVEQYGSPQFGQSVGVFSVTASSDDNRSKSHSIHIRPIKVDSKSKKLKADDMFGGKMMCARTISSVTQEDIDHFRTGLGDYDSNFSRLSSNSSVVVVPFIAPFQVSGGSIQLSDSSQNSVRCVLCLEVPMNESLPRNRVREGVEEDHVALSYLEHIVSQTVPTIAKLQSEMNSSLQTKFHQVLRIVHHASTLLKGPTVDSDGANKNSLVHLLQFVNAVQSEQVSKCFGVRRSALLISNAFLSELDFQQSYPLEQRDDFDYIGPTNTTSSSEGILRVSSRRNSIMFTQSTGDTFQTIVACDADLGTDSWLQELFNGNVVHLSAGSLDYGTTPQSQHDKSNAKLHALVSSVDSTAVSAVLMPLRSAMGLCILILFDKLNEVTPDNHELLSQFSTATHYRLFSDLYIQSIQNSGVCGDLIDALHNMRTVTLSEIKSSKEKAERDAKVTAWQQSDDEKALKIQKLENRFEKLLTVIPKYSKRETLHNFLRKWKLFVSNRVVAVRNKKFSLLLDGIKELIKVKIDCKEPDLLQKYFSIFEKRLATIFPLDNVSVNYDDAADVNDSHELLLLGSEHDLDDSYGQHSVRKSVLRGAVTFSHISQLVRRRKQSVEDNQTHTIASVSVTRKSTTISSIKRFEPDEVSLFHEFCGVASDLYSALHRGVQDDFSPGHARSLVFPMLREIVPAVLPSDTDVRGKGFEAIAIQKTSRTEGLLSLLSRWLKRMTNAEIVAINLRASGIGGVSDSVMGALHCTSEDSPVDYSHTIDTERSLREFLQTETISSDQNHFRILLKTDDSVVVPSTSSEFKSSRLESDIRIHFPQNRSTPISEEQIGAVEVVSYLLVYSLRNNRTHQQLLSETASIRDELEKVSEKLSSVQREASLLGASDSIVKFRLSAAISAQEFMNEIYTLESLPDLARYVSNMIPRLFGTESAVLVLKEFAFAASSSSKPLSLSLSAEYDGSLFHGSSATTARVDDQEKFFVVLPLNDDDSDNSKLENLGKRKALTASKLAKIDNFFHHRTSTQSKIELRNLINSKSRKKDSHLFGAILLFESDSPDRLKADGRWEGLEDVIIRSISSSIYHCTQRFGFVHQIETLTREGNKMQEVLQDKLQLESNFESLLQSESAFKKQRDDLSAQVSVLNERIRAVVQEKESLVSSFEQEVKTWKSKYEDNEEEMLRSTAALEGSIHQIQDELSTQRQHHSTLMDVIRGYVLDSRCSSKDTVIDWLRDTAEFLKLSLAVVSQSEAGELDGFSGIRGAAAAVGEALRTGQVVEFSSTTAKNSNKGSLRSGLTEYLEKSARSPTNLDILCVPNRLVLSQSKQGTAEIVCFLFIREQLDSIGQGDGETLFSQIERDTLTCGADLACRVLMKSGVKYSVEDFNRLETHLASETQIKNNLRLSIKCAEKLLFREHNTKSELVRAIEDAAKSLLLSLSTETDVFNITVDTKLHFTPISTSAVINESSSSVEFEAMSKVLRSGRALRKAGMLVVPISDAKSQICAILSCEKKLSAASSSSSIELLDKHNAEMIAGKKKSAMPHISDLLMTDADEEAVSILCFLVLPLLDKLNCLTDAYSGIQQAGQAIIALQQINAEIEDKLASAIAQRVAVESTMQCGLDILAVHFKPRMTAVHLLNVARAAIISVTSSSHCFVVLPAEVVRQDCDELNKLVTVDDEAIVDVHMDDIDIETSVLESTKRAYNDRSDRLENNDSIHSWSVRRVQSKRQHPQVSEFYYIQVIPVFVRLNGSENMACGFISTLRKAAKYSVSDKDIVNWIGQVLSLCLEQCIQGVAEEGRLKATEEDLVMDRVSEYVVRIEQLEKEAKELAKLESLRQGLEGDARLLLEDLSFCFKNAQLDPISAIEDDLIKDTVHAVFGNQSVYKSWQYSNAIDAFEFTFQLDNLANSSDTSANSSFCKESVSFGNIAATLWVDSDSVALQSMLRSSFIRLPHQAAEEEELDLQHRLQGLLRTVHRGQYSPTQSPPSRHKATIVLLFKGAQKGESDRWIVVSSVTESLTSIKIRLCMMMNILSGKMEWKKRVDQLNETIYQSTEKVKSMEYKLMVEKEVHQSDIEKGGLEVEKIKEVCKVTLERTKDKYKSLIREISQQRSSVEGVLVEATAFASRLRRQFKSRCSRRSVDQQWLHTALIDLAGTLSTLASIEMSVELVNRDSAAEESWNEYENIRHGSSKTLDIALKHSVSSNRIVIATTDTGKWETRLSTLYSLFYDKSSRENNTVLVLPNEDGDACFVPIAISSNSSKVFIVRVFFSKLPKKKGESPAQDSASSSSHFFGALLVAWISIKESVLIMCSDAEESWNLRERAQVAALKTVRMSHNLRNLRDMMPSHVLEVLKSMRLRAKLKSALSSEPELLAKLQEVKFQVRNLERSSADWKELVVGLNASTIGIMEGIPGLWAKACRSLLSILSSSLSLRGCGLIILSNDSDPAMDGKEVADERKRGSRRDRSSNRSGRKLSPADSDMIELTVRELIPPAMGRNTSGRSFNLPLPPYAKDVIEVRSVNELGRAVENLTLDIFNTGSATQRIFKLSRTAAQEERSNSEERLWLVPIKGVHSIVGLLRVSFSLPKEPFSPSTPISTIVKPMEFDSQRRAYSNDISSESDMAGGRTIQFNSNGERVLETAENNTINFADMLGPLLHAASQLSKEQTAKQHLQILAQNESTHLAATRKEEGLAKQKLSILLEIIDNIGRALLQEVKAMTSSSSSDDEQSIVIDWNVSIEEYSSQIAAALSAALRVRVKIVLESVFLIDQEMLTFSTAHANPKQPVESIPLTDKDNNIYGYMTWVPIESDPGDSRAMIEILSSFGSVVSGAITGAVRNLQLQLLVSKAKRTAQSTENALQLEQVVGFELQQKEEELSTLNELYRSLADILHQCLLFNAKLPLEMKSLQAEFGEIPIVEHRLSQSILLLELLRGLCDRLPRVVGDKSCMFSFAVVDGQLRVPVISVEESPSVKPNNPAASAAAVHNMAWVYSSSNSVDSAGVSLKDLPLSAKEMASNLAQIALSKRQKSSFDITFPRDDQSAAPIHYRIVTIPLKNMTIRSKRKSKNENIPLGVMQVFMDLAERKGEKEIERLCEDIASAVSCALSQDVFYQQLAALLEIKDMQQQVVEGKTDDLTSDIQKNQQISKIWQAVSNFSVIIIRHTCALQFSSSSAFVDKATAVSNFSSKSVAQLIASEEVVSCLFESGISLALVTGEINGTMSIPLGGSSNTYVSIHCTGADNILEPQLLQSCAEVVCTMIRSAVILEQHISMGNRDSRKRDSHAAKLIEKLKAAVHDGKQDTTSLQAIVADQSRSLQFLEESLTSTRQIASNIIPQYALPTVGDFSAALTAYCLSDDSDSDIYQTIVQVANEAMRRLAGNREGNDDRHHLTLFLREGSHHDSRLQLRAYTATASGGHITLPAGRSNDLSNKTLISKCFAMGGVHSKSIQPDSFVARGESNFDFLGMDSAVASRLFDSAKPVTVCCASLPPDCESHPASILRLVVQPGEDDKQLTAMRNIFEHLLTILAALSGALLATHKLKLGSQQKVSSVTAQLKKEHEQTLSALTVGSKMKKLLKGICREAITLLDPPMTDNGVGLAVHPATLTPMSASLDVCLKLLSMVRSLLRAPGQAILLKNPTESEADGGYTISNITEMGSHGSSLVNSYQVIYTGDTLAWPGVNPGSFGLVAGSPSSSLVNVVMSSKEPLVVADITTDGRYCPLIDGVVAKGTSVLMAPVRGRGGVVVGVLIAAKPTADIPHTSKKRGKTVSFDAAIEASQQLPFSHEDVSAAETCAAFGALSLYWCQGLGSVQQNLLRSINKMERLESTVQRLQSSKAPTTHVSDVPVSVPAGIDAQASQGHAQKAVIAKVKSKGKIK